MDFGYHVTLVRDATAAFSHEMMHAAHHLNGPRSPTPCERRRSYRLQANEHDNFAAPSTRRGAMGEGFFRAVTAAVEESQFFAE